LHVLSGNPSYHGFGMRQTGLDARLFLYCCCFIFSWDNTFKKELEVYRETKDVGDIW